MAVLDNQHHPMTTPQRTGPYSLIYADPPWRYQNYAYSETKTGTKAKRGVEKEYPTMSLTEICALPIQDLAAKDCLLAMWWVPPMPQEALDVIKAWGFTLKTMKGFTWHKTTVHGKSFFGMGNLTRCNTEDCLFAVRGKPKRLSASVRQFLESPRGKHSQKPSEARDRLVAMMGDVPRIELFARESPKGWDVFGNQVEGSIELFNTQHTMKNKPTDKWTVTTRKRDLEDPKIKTSRISVFEHSLKYEGKKVHSLTGHNGLAILTETASRYNEEGYFPTLSGTRLLFELSASKRKELDDLCAKSVPDLFAVESEVAS